MGSALKRTAAAAAVGGAGASSQHARARFTARAHPRSRSPSTPASSSTATRRHAQTLALSALSWRPLLPTRGAEGLSVAYFAFGANMATSSSPAAGRRAARRGAGPRQGPHARVQFARHTAVEPAFASIERAEPDAECHGVLYTLTPRTGQGLRDRGRLLAVRHGRPPRRLAARRAVRRADGARLHAAGGWCARALRDEPAAVGGYSTSSRRARENGLSLEWQRYSRGSSRRPSPSSSRRSGRAPTTRGGSARTSGARRHLRLRWACVALCVPSFCVFCLCSRLALSLSSLAPLVGDEERRRQRPHRKPRDFTPAVDAGERPRRARSRTRPATDRRR